MLVEGAASFFFSEIAIFRKKNKVERFKDRAIFARGF